MVFWVVINSVLLDEAGGRATGPAVRQRRFLYLTRFSQTKIRYYGLLRHLFCQVCLQLSLKGLSNQRERLQVHFAQ